MNLIRKAYVKIQYIFWAFKRVNKPHLGDMVIYDGYPCVLFQGVADPYWDLAKIGSGTIRGVNRDNFKLSNPITGRIDRIRKSYRFQMTSWYSIDTYNRKVLQRISYWR